MNTRIQEACEQAVARFTVPALAVGVAAGGRVETHAIGCGLEARFRIASVTKPLTALLALELLDPEETTGVWPDDVRVWHLLAHMTGYDCELSPRDLSRLGDGDGALAAAVAELGGVHRFVGVDEVWSYANTGYWLAGHLAGARAQATYEDALSTALLRPIGLEATSFGEPDLAGTGRDAEEGSYPRARRPSGGLVSTVGDVLRLGVALLDRPAFARMATVRGRPNGGVYGLGLFGQRVGGVDVWGHPGSYGGFQSSLVVVPSRRAVFAGLTNAGDGGKALYDVENAFFEQVIGTARPETRFVELPPAACAAFAGSYANVDERYEVRAEADGILLATEGEEVHLRPVGARTFEVASGPYIRDRVAFPRPGLGRFGSRLAERVA